VAGKLPCRRLKKLRVTTQQRRIQHAQRRARRYVKPGTSLVDELLAERREAARNE